MPVLNDDGRLVGMVTFTDIPQIHLDQTTTKMVRSVMTKELVTMTSDESLTQLLIR
jgi:predicted transcriptional regulator